MNSRIANNPALIRQFAASGDKPEIGVRTDLSRHAVPQADRRRDQAR